MLQLIERIFVATTAAEDKLKQKSHIQTTIYALPSPFYSIYLICFAFLVVHGCQRKVEREMQNGTVPTSK